MDGAKIGVLEESHNVGFSRLLQCEQSRGLEAELALEVLRYLTAQALERQLADEQLGGLLVLSYLAESHSAGAESK